MRQDFFNSNKMRYFYSILFGLFAFIHSNETVAQWKKVNDVDYIWGPFKIYNISLFTEDGEYREHTRPILLSFNYEKPVDGRDFAISLVRSWKKLGINLPEEDKVIDRLRKILPNIKVGDKLHYIALDDKGYFMLNDTIIDQIFERDFNDAIVSIWLDSRVEIGRKLVNKSVQTEKAHQVIGDEPPQNESTFSAGVAESAPDEMLGMPVKEESQKDSLPTEKVLEQAVEKQENLESPNQEDPVKEEPKQEKEQENKEHLPLDDQDIEIEIHLPSDPVPITPNPFV